MTSPGILLLRLRFKFEIEYNYTKNHGINFFLRSELKLILHLQFAQLLVNGFQKLVPIATGAAAINHRHNHIKISSQIGLELSDIKLVVDYLRGWTTICKNENRINLINRAKLGRKV